MHRDKALQRINAHYREKTATPHDHFRELIARDDVDAVIGYQVRKPLTWDPVSERFRGDNATAANALLARESNTAWQS